MEDLRFMRQLTKERVSSIISKVPAGFLMKAEAELLIHILFQYERAIAFTDLECGTFSQKYYPSSASYHLTFFAVEKKGGDLRVIHNLQPLNAVTMQDATLPPHVDNMIESFSSQAIYGLFDLKSSYDS